MKGKACWALTRLPPTVSDEQADGEHGTIFSGGTRPITVFFEYRMAVDYFCSDPTPLNYAKICTNINFTV